MSESNSGSWELVLEEQEDTNNHTNNLWLFGIISGSVVVALYTLRHFCYNKNK